MQPNLKSSLYDKNRYTNKKIYWEEALTQISERI